jgi:hypothetical protein
MVTLKGNTFFFRSNKYLQVCPCLYSFNGGRFQLDYGLKMKDDFEVTLKKFVPGILTPYFLVKRAHSLECRK